MGTLDFFSDFIEQLEDAGELVVKGENGGDVAAAVAIVGSGPYSDQIPVGEVVLVTLHYELMRPTYELHIVHVSKLLRIIHASHHMTVITSLAAFAPNR